MDLSSDFVPSEPIPVVRLNPETHQREYVHLHWGLIPAWVSAPSLGGRLTHARAETVATKRAFREVFRRRRCLVVVDSFQSSLGDYASQQVNATNGHPHANMNGHVRSNQDVILNARATIFGDATPGPTGIVDDAATDTYISGSDTPAAEVFDFPPIEVPVFPPSGIHLTPPGTSTTISSGQYAYDSLTVGNGGTLTIEGPAELVVQDFTGNKDGQLLVDATNGPVTIYVEGSYTHIKDFECNAVPGSPMALAFMVTAPQDIVFPSATEIRGAYYLPEADILFASGNEAWGSFAANKIEMSNEMNFHFDEDLADYFKADTGQSAGIFELVSWSETEVVMDDGTHDIVSDRRDPLVILGVRKYDLPRPADAWVVVFVYPLITVTSSLPLFAT